MSSTDSSSETRQPVDQPTTACQPTAGPSFAPITMSASASFVPGPAAAESSTAAASRVRHLRACDRCRSRKIRCDEASPCSRCQKANVQCTFAPNPRILAESTGGGSSEAAAAAAAAAAGPSTEIKTTTRKKRKAEGGEKVAPPETAPFFLGIEDTAQFFTTSEGLARFCGSTSGLPLLEATFRLTRAQASAAPAPTSTDEPDWDWLDQLLSTGRPANSANGDAPASTPGEEQEFFPGRELKERGKFEAHSLVTELIPPDLLHTLLGLYFDVVYPQFPIIHIPTFLKNTHKWREPAFAALIVAMCMLASRYCSDPRVRAEPDNPTSAGYHYFDLFRELRDMASLDGDDPVEACQALFCAAFYHCVDTLPHPIAQGLFADAVSRVYDGGLHRDNRNAAGLGDTIELEVRKRTAWACYCLDKTMAAVAGRPPLLPLAYFDVDPPVDYPNTPGTSPTDQHAFRRDAADCEAFGQLVFVSAALEKSLAACCQPPRFEGSAFLDKLGGSREYKAEQDFTRLDDAEGVLLDWVKQLPPSFRERNVNNRIGLATFTPRNEAILATEDCCRIILAGRRLQLTTVSLTNAAAKGESTASLRVELRKHRHQLLAAVKTLVSAGVKLGASGNLSKCDIFLGYRLLMAGRLTLAIVLSAQEDNDGIAQEQATRVLEACLTLLKHFSLAFPISLGAAETLKETCRVCKVNLSKVTLDSSSRGRYAWHRPLARSGRVAPPASSLPRPELPQRASANNVQASNAGPNHTSFSPPFLSPQQPNANQISQPFFLSNSASDLGGHNIPDFLSTPSSGVSTNNVEDWSRMMQSGFAGGPSLETPPSFSMTGQGQGQNDTSDLSWLFPSGLQSFTGME